MRRPNRSPVRLLKRYHFGVSAVVALLAVAGLAVILLVVVGVRMVVAALLHRWIEVGKVVGHLDGWEVVVVLVLSGRRTHGRSSLGTACRVRPA